MVVHVDDWPLIGRARELAAVGAALTRPAAAGVLLAGPPGVGKSRLAGECLGRATGHGFHVEHVRATRSSSQIPLGALAPLLPFDNTGEVAGDVLRGVAASIGAARDDGRRLLLAVDDAHLLDDASATVVNHLVTSGRCSVMLTVRTGESAPDPVTALWKDLAVERLDIGPLIPDHVDELLTVVLGGRVDGVTRREFWDASHGNALFVARAAARRPRLRHPRPRRHDLAPRAAPGQPAPAHRASRGSPRRPRRRRARRDRARRPW